MESLEPRPGVKADKLVLGIALIALGIVGFLGAIDLLYIRDVWRLWPLLLIVIGIGNEVEAIRNRRKGGGWVLIAIGTWFLIGNFHIFGLSHSRAIPVIVVIAGASIALHALIDRPALPAAPQENHHGQQHDHQ
ncbi:MAG TPA: DUF5668 domain-containing protein [Thermoanaerobaculia bacterium]|nr:DUF5668 domain-containing protein [Thermoanaerobaculia bacterium]